MDLEMKELWMARLGEANSDIREIDEAVQKTSSLIDDAEDLINLYMNITGEKYEARFYDRLLSAVANFIKLKSIFYAERKKALRARVKCEEAFGIRKKLRRSKSEEKLDRYLNMIAVLQKTEEELNDFLEKEEGTQSDFEGELDVRRRAKLESMYTHDTLAVFRGKLNRIHKALGK